MNECFENDQTCGANATCLNSPGTHRCVCKSGYEKISDSPFQCEDKVKFETNT